MYNTDSLKQGIIKAHDNIEVFKTAIQKEKDTIKEYEGMIKVLEEKKEMAEGKQVEIIRE